KSRTTSPEPNVILIRKNELFNNSQTNLKDELDSPFTTRHNEGDHNNIGYIKTNSFNSNGDLKTKIGAVSEDDNAKQIKIADDKRRNSSIKNANIDEESSNDEEDDNEGFEKLDSQGNMFGLVVRALGEGPSKAYFRNYLRIKNVLILIAIAVYLGLTIKDARNCVSLIGVFVLILLGTLGSKHPHRFILATFVIRISVGYEFFNFLGNEVSKFINYVEAGAVFVYGENYEDHFFAFRVTSIIIFLGSVINVLYYLGAMQWIIGKIAWLMQKILDTTAAESMNAAANIFVGMSEAPLMIMPLLPNMTVSELHAVLVGGFATMAGSVLATFIFFGVPANHLIAASVMAAPGALGFAKLLLPETHKSKTTWEIVKNVQLPQQHNVIDALLTGAGNALKVCGYLIANLVAFISVLKFLDVTISWLFTFIHHPEINFQYLLGLLFYPFAVITGIPIRDCLVSSKLIGIKVALNEFIAYEKLGEIRKLRTAWISNGTYELYRNGTLPIPTDTLMLWNDSSVTILTYALCGKLTKCI
ncbi:unnamed protein product, partial [Didymodactylos carnosus]